MNTVGKTLVILNLLFALVTGGFLVVDFATRTNWKKSYDDLNRETTVAKANTETMLGTNGRLMAEVKKLETENLNQLKKYEQFEKDMRKKIEAEVARANDERIRAEKGLPSIEMSSQEQERLRVQNKGLTAQLKNRDETIVALEAKANKFYSEAQAAAGERDATILRNENLLENYRALERKLAKGVVGPATGVTASATSIKDRGQPNPPSSFVKGIVEKIDGTDRSLVQLSIGTDAGVQVDHTLEIYRLSPRAEYLGQLRIVETTEHRAIGRLIRVEGMPVPVLRVNDEVASTLRPR